MRRQIYHTGFGGEDKAQETHSHRHRHTHTKTIKWELNYWYTMAHWYMTAKKPQIKIKNCFSLLSSERQYQRISLDMKPSKNRRVDHRRRRGMGGAAFVCLRVGR